MKVVGIVCSPRQGGHWLWYGKGDVLQGVGVGVNVSAVEEARNVGTDIVRAVIQLAKH